MELNSSNYRFVIGFNGSLIVLGAMGVLAPATSALLHNLFTLRISVRSMTNLLPQKMRLNEKESRPTRLGTLLLMATIASTSSYRSSIRKKIENLISPEVVEQTAGGYPE